MRSVYLVARVTVANPGGDLQAATSSSIIIRLVVASCRVPVLPGSPKKASPELRQFGSKVRLNPLRSTSAWPPIHILITPTQRRVIHRLVTLAIIILTRFGSWVMKDLPTDNLQIRNAYTKH
jgi:hypothetical protein